MAFLRSDYEEDGESHWLSVADLMAGLMMVFLFIAVALMRLAQFERDTVKEIAVAYQDNQIAIYEELIREFSDDLVKWDAEIERDTLTFSFNSPEILFARGSETLKAEYRSILVDFFPRYMDVMKKFEPSIDEVRIEGHTSTVWNDSASASDAYFKNMDLSQRRTSSVLQYVYYLPAVADHQTWLQKNMSAVGMSSARIRLDDASVEDSEGSRRVGFRVVTKADLQIKKILDI